MWLETQRLLLREFRQDDYRELAPIQANPQVMKFSQTGILSTSQTKEKIENFITSYKQFGFGKWAVILKQSSQLIGYCGIAVEQIDGKNEQEIGYRLDPRFWSQGLATEAAVGATDYGFAQFKFPYLLGIVERANPASVRVLEKLRMHFERMTVFHGVPMDVYRVDAI
ncbi:MAG: GNAT family N-acetyltransferase [Acaryochloris sp. RU_4_1]|nr:GNAT family N-acetyltransferase [Acaryochloris sp. RU_4_1]NJR55140.1 GNAT family N-acetyltransferase [Acaryochloris sp. CRU_2_0]